MIIIEHKGGWSCSNQSEVDHTKEAIRDDNGKIKGFKSTPFISVKQPFTVKGELSGDVKVAIQDDVTKAVTAYSGFYHDGKITNLNDISKEFLVYLK